MSFRADFCVLQVVVQNSTLYTYSQRAWQQCALFQKSAASFLERSGYTGNYSSSGQTELYINDRWTFRSYITDLTTNQTGTLRVQSSSSSKVPEFNASGHCEMLSVGVRKPMADSCWLIAVEVLSGLSLQWARRTWNTLALQWSASLTPS